MSFHLESDKRLESIEQRLASMESKLSQVIGMVAVLTSTLKELSPDINTAIKQKNKKVKKSKQGNLFDEVLPF